MKKICYLLLAVLLAGTVTSCEKDVDKIVEMTIGSKLLLMHDGESSMDIPALARKVGPDRWEWTFSIEGFTFEEGYECVLLVAVIPVKEPMQGGPNVRYKMLKLISKEKKDSW